METCCIQPFSITSDGLDLKTNLTVSSEITSVRIASHVSRFILSTRNNIVYVDTDSGKISYTRSKKPTSRSALSSNHASGTLAVLDDELVLADVESPKRGVTLVLNRQVDEVTQSSPAIKVIQPFRNCVLVGDCESLEPISHPK